MPPNKFPTRPLPPGYVVHHQDNGTRSYATVELQMSARWYEARWETFRKATARLKKRIQAMVKAR